MSGEHKTDGGPRQEGHKRTPAGRNGGAAPKPPANLLGAYEHLAAEASTAELFTFNAMTGKAILSDAPPWDRTERDYPRAIDDIDIIGCQIHLQRAGLRRIGERSALGAMLWLAHERAFHPMQDYFNALVWDGEARLDTWLSYYAGAEDSVHVRQVGRMFLISMAARALKPGCQCDHVLVLEGKQGIGKSSLCRILGGPWFSCSLPPIGGNFKDTQSHLRGLMLVEIPELEAFSKAEASQLKAYISTPCDRYRAPYGRSEIEVPRTCVFVMTTNESNYLSDHSGARRFWPVACSAIDLAALEHDRDQLLAEAVVRFKAGEPWWPDHAVEAEHIAPEQAARLEELPWMGAIAGWLEKQIAGHTSVQEVFELALKGTDLLRLDKRAQMQIANCLRELGWWKHKTNGRTLWRKPGT